MFVKPHDTLARFETIYPRGRRRGICFPKNSLGLELRTLLSVGNHCLPIFLSTWLVLRFCRRSVGRLVSRAIIPLYNQDHCGFQCNLISHIQYSCLGKTKLVHCNIMRYNLIQWYTLVYLLSPPL